MTTAIDVVKNYNRAFESKDAEALKPLIHPAYTFKGPMMEMNGRDQMLAFLQTCPFSFKNQNVKFVAQGNTVVQTFDWQMTAPFKASIPMCELLEVENGQIKSGRLFYDTGAFPKEAQEMMQDMMQQRKAC